MHRGTVPVKLLANDPNIDRMKGSSGFPGGLKGACLSMGDCLVSYEDAMEMLKLHVSDKRLKQLVPLMRRQHEDINKNIVLIMIGTPQEKVSTDD